MLHTRGIFLLRAPRPHRFAEHPDGFAVRIGENLEKGRQQAPGIASHLAHVEQVHPIHGGSEGLLERSEPVARHRHHHELALGDPA